MDGQPRFYHADLGRAHLTLYQNHLHTSPGTVVAFIQPTSSSIDRAQFDEEHDTVEYCYVFGNFYLPSDYVLLECTTIKHNLRHCFVLQ